MNISHSVPSTVSSVSFSFLSSQDIKRISVKQIVNPVLLDDLNRPNVGGLYDPALGPSTPQDICSTCRLSYYSCPGHFGHIELPAPVFHPLFMVNMYNVLRGTCLFCHKFKLGVAQKAKFIGILRLLEHGLLEAARTLETMSVAPKQSARLDPEAEENAMDEDGESAEEFAEKINLFVMASLHRASSSKRDDYKDGQVYQARKEIIAQFLKVTMLKKCSNCHVHGYTFRKEGHTKIIEYDLSQKQKDSNMLLNISRPNVLSRVRAQAKNGAPVDEGYGGSDESDVEMADEDAPAPQASFTDDENEDDEPVSGRTVGQPARAANGKEKTIRGRNERVLTAEECRAHLRRLFANDTVICSLVFGRHGPFASMNTRSGLAPVSADIFFMDVIPVSPTRFRPPAKLGETLFEHAQNELLTKILNTSYRLRDLNTDLRAATAKGPAQEGDPTILALDRNRILGSLIESLIQLQVDVNSFMDSNKNPTPVRQGKLPPAGVKQGLEKKEGLFRKHMMGKRVNYAARSVISPDVNIETNEIGIPPVFARTLTFPVPVTDANVSEMRQLVINGPQWPGASMLEMEDGSLVTLAKMSLEARTALANTLLTPQDGNKAASLTQGLTTRTPTVNKKVYRHLRDGDVLILNRQPTLHKPSMMAHKARVLKGEKTIRMHYANCNSYNADFDGDEMNIHFPQNQIPRAEAMMIANTDNQYLVPTSGAPLRGLIQDHVVAGVWMTNKQTFFTRDEYHQILFGALRPEDNYSGDGRVLTVPPAIWKPQPLWTGKQIISTVMKNITPRGTKGLNLRSKNRVPNKFWGPHSSEQEVVFMDGELVCGVLDKSQFGATSYGLVHAVYELYGAEIAGKLLSILSRLFSKFLQHRAFTCRMDDLALTPAGEAARKTVMEKGAEYGTIAAVDNFPSLADPSLTVEEKEEGLRTLLEEVLRDDNKMAGLDMTVKMKMKSLKKAVDDHCIPGGLLRKFPDNHMQAMVMTGAKGSGVNAGQISAALGQQELEGRRVPVMVSGKTLPSFKAFETAAIAGGYIGSRFLTGLRPQEFYFHCMAGREGLIDTAVKTSRSGYLQRCLIKHLEGIRVHYDHTVRGSDSSIYQFQYGGDGLDVTKQKYLLEGPKQQDELFHFAAQNQEALADRIQFYELAGRIDENEAVAYMKKALKKPEKYPPALSVYNPSRFLGATSERFGKALNNYVSNNPHGVIRKPKEGDPALAKRRRLVKAAPFRGLMHARYMRSLVDPGEAVGLLASQGVGEPSTQMTLNTFHFAGHGAANVTLGIPRLREIVMTASMKPKTPTMTLPVARHITSSGIEAFCKEASRLTLSQVVDFVTVQETLSTKNGARERTFSVAIELFPRAQYEDEYKVRPKDVLKALGSSFGLMLKKEIQVELKKYAVDLKSQAANIGKGQKEPTTSGARDQGEDGDDDAAGPSDVRDDVSEVGDGDADDAKRSRQTKEQASYDDSEDEEDEDDEDGSDVDSTAELEAQFSDNEEATQAAAKLKKSSQSESSAERLKLANDSFSAACGWAVPSSLTFQSKEASRCTFDLKFPAETPKLLLVGIIERCCVKTIIHQISGITRCLHVKKDSPDDKPEKMMTEGSNFYGIWDFAGETVDLNHIESNDVYAILTTYGVEAARTTIVNEIQGIFGAYGISVDGRHVELIADYMTFDGGYKPFNRKGISTSSSPLLKASYETTAAFLSDATLFGDFDDLSSPSGSIVLGRPTKTGTGVFDVVADFGATPM